MYDGKSISSETTSGTSQVGGLVGRAKSKTTKSVSAQGGQSLSRSSLPTRDGYVATWYTDSNLTKEYDFSQPVTADMTLYAKWTEGKNDIETWDGTSSEPKYNADTKTYTVTNGKELAWVSDVTNGVIISGTNWRPEVHGAEYYHKEIMKLLDNPNVTDRAVKTGLWLMRSQIFKDGNKRIGSFAINKILIENGKGIFKVPVEIDGTFKQMLVSYYESNNADELAEWIYDNCLDGVNPVKVKEKAENY